ncbi:MAG: hypothetical protein ACFFAK_03940 [Promethearchaeota archaeon]
MFKNINRKVLIIGILIMVFNPILIVNFLNLSSKKTVNNVSEDNVLKAADIAGTDLYAERINAFVAGNKSIIKQSLFTNDTNILPHFDLRDPAFYQCNLLFSASNGITPNIFPRVLNENGFSYQYEMCFNGFSGFLYYDEKLDEDDAKIRANRALEIIRRKFAIDLILINVSEPNFFPFIGHYPDWKIFLHELTTNLPMDGYWKALDINRLTSEEYLVNHHISSTFFLLNSLDFFEKDLFESINQVDFNLDSLDLSFIYSLEIENLFEQFTNIDFETIFGNLSQFIGDNQTISQEDVEEFSEFFDIFSLSNKSHYTSIMIQYEGVEEAIQKVSNNQYRFNLWNALNYSGEPLRPSEKIFIALAGAFMSEIDITILCSDIIDTTPEYFDLYDFLLEQIELILFYAGVDFDIDTVRDYTFELFWVDKGGIKQNYIKPVNLDDPTDFINFLPILGVQGLPSIPTGIFDPIQEFIVTYLINTSEPNIMIRKELVNENASFGVYKDFSFNITAKNIGNETCWGVPTQFPLDLDDFLSIIILPLIALDILDVDDFKDDLWQSVEDLYPNQYDSLEDFFNCEEDPRIFYFDTLGLGLIDTYYPNINNVSNLWPYNENADAVLADTFTTNQIYNILDLEESQELFTNEYSIWNAENWRLEPGEKISYIYSNFSIDAYDSYTEFYKYNFTIKESIPKLPVIISGFSIMGTNPYMALTNDEESWVIEAEEKYLDQYDLELVFLFQNHTNIDFTNKSLDSISISINYTGPFDVIELEVFNYSVEEYQNINPYLTSRDNNTSTFSFTNVNGDLNWIFDPYAPNNYTIIIRIKGTDSNVFNVSINDFNIHFLYRDINEYKGQSSRIIYSSTSGKIQYVRRSNSISLSTHNMSSIIAFSQLSNYNLRVGDLNTYTLHFQNIGTNIAQAVNISILIPGIIQDNNNFTIKDNYLTYFLPELAPLEEKEISFTFYVPNSESIFSTVIIYKDSQLIANLNNSELNAKPNEVYLSALVDYYDYFPFVHALEIYLNSSNLAPSIGGLFNLSLNLKNVGPSNFSIEEINFTLGDQFGDLIYASPNHSLSLKNIEFNNIRTINFTLKKNDWKGYYYPSIAYLDNKDNRIFQILSSTPIVLGNISFLISKSVSQNQIEVGEIITVNVTIVNTGTICVKNVTLSDIISFNQIEFTLIEGNLIKMIEQLEANETISISYKIKAKTQSLVTLKPASIEYYFLSKSKEISNQIMVKIIIPTRIQLYFTFIPSLVSLLILIYFIWRTRKYRTRKYEIQRSEMVLFKKGPRESILKIENTLKEQLAKLDQEKNKIPKVTDNTTNNGGGE